MLPRPRGELSGFLLERLKRPAADLPASVPAIGGDPLSGEDFQLSLYILYELHYRGFEGVDEEWEWQPTLLALRRQLEHRFESALRDRVAGHIPEPDDIPAQLKGMIADSEGPSLSRFLEMRAGLEHLREFLVHRSAYQLKEADPHAWAVPRLSGRAKVALMEIQSDEYGGGRPEREHSRLFANTMQALGLDSAYGAYVDVIPGYTLATVNLMSMCGLHRRLRGAIVGHLAILEMDSTLPNRRYGNALRRLGYDATATDFFDEHVEADAVHEALASRDLAAALASDDPLVAPDILFGARAMLLLDSAAARAMLRSWQYGESSLLDD
ncbi:MAG: iron-containing redox enzyme family protein [Thermoleophilaceae bacterium]